MNPTEILTGRELEDAVCTKLGWTPCECGGFRPRPGGWCEGPCGTRFGQSLDWCFGLPNRPGITEWLDAHGLQWSLTGGGQVANAMVGKSHTWKVASHPIAATALCHAFLSLLEETG